MDQAQAERRTEVISREITSELSVRRYPVLFAPYGNQKNTLNTIIPDLAGGTYIAAIINTTADCRTGNRGSDEQTGRAWTPRTQMLRRKGSGQMHCHATDAGRPAPEPGKYANLHFSFRKVWKVPVNLRELP